MELLIFDLDGTLIDSGSDLALATNATLKHMKRPPIDEKTVNSYVGDGAAMLVKRALGADISESEFDEAIGYFIDFYRSHALVNTRFYPGVKETLAELDERRYRMAVLTNKPEKISQDILRELGVAKYFFRVYGGNSFPSKKPDPIGIHTLLKEAAVGHSAAMMIGDTNVDIRTARNAHVTACGVTWGFKPESLNDPAPDFLIDKFADLLTICPHNMALS